MITLVKKRAILRMIIEDCESDASTIDGRPFNGKTVAENFGRQLAMIQALARLMLDDDPKGDSNE